MNDVRLNDERELDRLIDRMCDQIASADELEQLGQRLSEDPAARDHYIASLELHARLAWQITPGKAFSPDELCRYANEYESPETTIPFDVPSLSPLPSPLSSPFVGSPAFSYMVATVVLCLMLLGAWAYKMSHVNDSHIADNSRRSTISGPLGQEKLSFVGKITGMKDCRWSNPDTGTIIGALVPLDREYALTSGLMEITYVSGAKVILEGPCKYKVDSRAGGYLARGKLTARVEAKGSEHSPLSSLPSPLFAVRTPTAKITDLGTEFGVEVDENGDTVSYVFQGSIKVQGLAASASSSTTEKILRENESIQVSRVRETHQGQKAQEQVRFTHPTTSPKFVRKISRFTKEYVYDFSRCEPGNIDGQDGWYVDLNHNRPSATNYISVAPNAVAPMSGNYAFCIGDDQENNVLVRRINDRRWSYSIPSNADWELSALVYVGPPDGGAESTLLIHKRIDGKIYKPNHFGVGSRGTEGYNVQWRVGDKFYFALLGEAFNEVCFCQVGMTAKSLGDNRYNIALWYETTPGDENTRRYFRSIINVEADMAAYDTLTVYGSRRNEYHPQSPIIDNLTIRVE